jgi:hypothetical protein
MDILGNFVDRIHKKHLRKDNLRQLTTLAPLTKNEDIPRAAITYYPAITNQLQNIFNKHIIMLVHSNKDKSEQLEKSGIYEIKCDGCNTVYIGQTRRSVSVRFGEHFRHIRLNHPNLSNIACHVLEHIGDPNSQHKISIDNVSLIKEIRKPHQLDAYEADVYIMQRKKKNVELMNGDEGNVRSRLFDVLF